MLMGLGIQRALSPCLRLPNAPRDMTPEVFDTAELHEYITDQSVSYGLFVMPN
jgi:hypothetical protein